MTKVQVIFTTTEHNFRKKDPLHPQSIYNVNCYAIQKYCIAIQKYCIALDNVESGARHRPLFTYRQLSK